MDVKLMIVDDGPAIPDRLLAMLGGVERLTAVAIARTLGAALQKCSAFAPDVIVLDIQLPDGNGLDGLAALKARCPDTPVFVFSNHVEYQSRALQAGAERFFDKSLEFEALIDCLDALAVQSGRTPGARP
ncbi:MAG: response regulator transcription factor [Zoogloea sp.]|nr:response regulator transcription factor [Zoogloea sp.]